MKKINNIFFMLKYVWISNKKAFIYRLVYLLFSAIPMAYRVIVFKLIIDAIEQNRDFVYILIIIIIYMTIELVTRLFASFVFSYQNEKLSIQVAKKLNILLLEKVSGIDVECFDDPEFNDTLLRAVKEADVRAMTVFNQFFQLLTSVLGIIISFTIVFVLNPWLIVIAVFSAVIFYVLDIKFIKKQYDYRNAMATPDRKMKYFKNLFYDRKTLFDFKQFSNLKNIFSKKYVASCDEKLVISKKIANDRFKRDTIVGIIAVMLNYLLPLSYIAYQGVLGLISLGDISALWNSFNLFNNSFSDLSRNVTQLKESSLFADNFKKILMYKPKIENNIGGKDIENNQIKVIEFRNVNFIYPHSDKLVLKNISFKVENGEKLAIVGINGVGKTTIVKLLMRFYDVTSGKILINNIDIKEYTTKSIRESISSIFQDFQLYSILLSEQISCEEVESIDEKKMIKVLKIADMYNKIINSPQGLSSNYSKQFDKDGLILSGGELQKIAISRVLYKDSSAFIMDEPSSSLDPISEYNINNIVSEISHDKILLLISHRLSTTRDADKILFLEDGAIVEQGRHEKLIQLNGKYAFLFNVQAKEYAK